MTFALLDVVSGPVGYLVLAALVGIESTGVPVPGETALITAGVLANHGRLDIVLVVVIAAAAAIIGDNIGYLIGRTGGRALILRPGPFEERRREFLRHGEPFFRAHGPKAVFLGRWVAGLRIAAAWLAGINHMHWRTFLFWNALGGIAWATSVGVAAYLLGPAVEKIVRDVGFGGVGVVVVLVLGFFLVRRARRRSAASRAQQREPEHTGDGHRQQPPAGDARVDEQRGRPEREHDDDRDQRVVADDEVVEEGAEGA